MGANPAARASRARPSDARSDGAGTYERRQTDRGPHGDLLSGSVREYGADPLGSMRRWRDRFGDLVPVRFGPFRALLAFGPVEVTEVLVAHAKDYRKSLGTRALIPVLGKGLLTDEGDSWLRSRRLIAPAFHRERVATYAPAIVDAAETQMAGWQDGTTVDLGAEMAALTLRIHSEYRSSVELPSSTMAAPTPHGDGPRPSTWNAYPNTTAAVSTFVARHGWKRAVETRNCASAGLSRTKSSVPVRM